MSPTSGRAAIDANIRNQACGPGAMRPTPTPTPSTESRFSGCSACSSMKRHQAAPVCCLPDLREILQPDSRCAWWRADDFARRAMARAATSLDSAASHSVVTVEMSTALSNRGVAR